MIKVEATKRLMYANMFIKIAAREFSERNGDIPRTVAYICVPYSRCGDIPPIPWAHNDAPPDHHVCQMIAMSVPWPFYASISQDASIFFLKNGIGLQYLIVKTLNNIIRLVDTVQLKASFQIRPLEYLIAQAFSRKGLPKSWITCFIDKQNAVKTSSRKKWDLRNQYQTTADFEGDFFKQL